jgi:hypothetical protein
MLFNERDDRFHFLIEDQAESGKCDRRDRERKEKTGKSPE